MHVLRVVFLVLVCVALLHAEEAEHSEGEVKSHEEEVAAAHPEGDAEHSEDGEGGHDADSDVHPELLEDSKELIDGHEENVDHPDEGSGEVHHTHWTYSGQLGTDLWHAAFPLCTPDSPRQSPIDIQPEKAQFNDELGAIDLVFKEDEEQHHMTVINNGHSVNVRVDSDIFASGGQLGDVYKVAGFHFHWGSEDSQGSEHTLEGHPFPLEMHVVMYDSEKYTTLEDAVFGDNSLAVLGTVFEISEENNTAFQPLIDSLEHVTQPGSEYEIPALTLTDLIAPEPALYFRYFGSLTTPPCAESVVWTLFAKKQTISEYQLDMFRDLVMKDDHDADIPMMDNWRPTQPLHDRTVTRSFKLASDDLEAKEAEKPVVDSSNGAATFLFGLATLLTMTGALLL